MADEPLGLADRADGVGVDDHRARRGQRQRQDLRDVAHPGPDQDRADARVVDLGGVGLDDRRGQIVDREAGRDADIARPRRAAARADKRDRAGHLAGEAMDQPAAELVPAGIERRERGRADLEPVACDVDADVGDDDAAHAAPSPASAGARASARRRSRSGRQRRPATASAPSSLDTPLGRSQATVTSAASTNSKVVRETASSSPRLRPVPNRQSISIGAGSASASVVERGDAHGHSRALGEVPRGDPAVGAIIARPAQDQRLARPDEAAHAASASAGAGALDQRRSTCRHASRLARRRASRRR